MKLNFSQLTYDAVWFNFETGERLTGEPEPDRVALKIRPRPRSQTRTLVRDGALILDGAERLATFRFCLVDWHGVTDETGKPLPCSEAVKEKVFDFDMVGIPLFVIERVNEFWTQKDSQEKNS